MFLLEPMAAKMVLPLLGGAPAVWNTCVVFFQAMLLAGYAYAHGGRRWLGVRRQAAVSCSPGGCCLADAALCDREHDGVGRYSVRRGCCSCF